MIKLATIKQMKRSRKIEYRKKIPCRIPGCPCEDNVNEVEFDGYEKK